MFVARTDPTQDPLRRSGTDVAPPERKMLGVHFNKHIAPLERDDYRASLLQTCRSSGALSVHISLLRSAERTHIAPPERDNSRAWLLQTCRSSGAIRTNISLLGSETIFGRVFYKHIAPGAMKFAHKRPLLFQTRSQVLEIIGALQRQPRVLYFIRRLY